MPPKSVSASGDQCCREYYEHFEQKICYSSDSTSGSLMSQKRKFVHCWVGMSSSKAFRKDSHLSRAVASGAEAGGGVAALVAVEEGVGAGGSAARPPVSRPEPARARSWRVVGLGRRVARGGCERGTKPSPTATNTSAKTAVLAPERRVQPLAVWMPRHPWKESLGGRPPL